MSHLPSRCTISAASSTSRSSPSDCATDDGHYAGPRVGVSGPSTEVAPRAGITRDCRRGYARAAVMQVRPLSVSSGTAGLSPFGRSVFGPLWWL